MKDFYSVIYLVGNKASDEKISIGLLAGLYDKPILEYSEKKLKKALSLIDIDVDSNIRNLLSNYKRKVDDFNSKDVNISLIKTESWPFNFSRAKYLSRSADGIVEFSKPKFPTEILSKKRFINLFRLLVDSDYLSKDYYISEEKGQFKETIDNFKKSEIVKERADINLKLDNNTFSTIYDEAKIDLLSCNGGILSGNAIDFSMGEDTIEKHLYFFRALSEGIIKFSNENNIREAPKNILFFNRINERSKERILNSVHNDKEKPFKLLEVNELEKIEKELESRNYHKFSERFL